MQAQFCSLPALANPCWRALHSASLPQPLYSDARLRLCWFLAIFAVLVRESFLLSRTVGGSAPQRNKAFQLPRTVGHSPYRLKSSKSALCKHSTFFLFQPARLIAYAHYIIFPYIYTTTTLQKVFLSVN